MPTYNIHMHNSLQSDRQQGFEGSGLRIVLVKRYPTECCRLAYMALTSIGILSLLT